MKVKVYQWLIKSKPLKEARADAKEAWGKLAEQCIAHAATIHKLAAEQAKSMQLREALESCGFADDSTDPEMCGPYYDAELVHSALSTTSDTSALEAYVTKAGEKMREKCSSICKDEATDAFADGEAEDWGRAAVMCSELISAIPAVTLEDLK